MLGVRFSVAPARCLGVACLCASLWLARSASAEPNAPASVQATAPVEAPAPVQAPAPEPEPEPAPLPPPPPPVARTRPLSFYVSHFIAGTAFATAQVTLVWALIEHDDPTPRDRLLIISAVSAGTALAAITIGTLVAASDAKRTSASAYVGPGGIGIRGTF